MERLPSRSTELRGEPLEVRYRAALRDTAGNEAHAATFIRRRLIVLDACLLHDDSEHSRILAHELFHFVWVRLGNTRRESWGRLLASEWNIRARGEAGWSAEWRKMRLRAADIQRRSRAWREYSCEAFCDTAAVLETGVAAECTLSPVRLRTRSRWFQEHLAGSTHI